MYTCGETVKLFEKKRTQWKRDYLGGEWFYYADIGGSAAKEADISTGLLIQAQ